MFAHTKRRPSSRYCRDVFGRRSARVLVSVALALSACDSDSTSAPESSADQARPPSAFERPATTVVTTAVETPTSDTHAMPAQSSCRPPADAPGPRVPPGTWVRSDPHLTVTIRADVEFGCAGHTVPITITYYNSDNADVVVDSPVLVLADGLYRWRLGQVDPVAVDATSRVTVHAAVRLPKVADGTYTIRVNGYAPGGTVPVGSPWPRSTEA
jgi:hypothetical protein